jgi:S-adenosylmethionine:tRNA ribosyltransferase-isomerase
VDGFLGGDGRWRGIYDRALEEGFFFLSYGDAMLIL